MKSVPVSRNARAKLIRPLPVWSCVPAASALRASRPTMTPFVSVGSNAHNCAAAPATIAAELDVARRRVERAREQGFDKPLAWDGAYPSLGLRRAVQYSKGVLFLAHLRETIGDEAFWKGLRAYTRRHAGATVTSRDFQNAMQGRQRTRP